MNRCRAIEVCVGVECQGRIGGFVRKCLTRRLFLVATLVPDGLREVDADTMNDKSRQVVEE